MVISFFRNDFVKIIQGNVILRFSLIGFFANVSLYWFFPGLNPAFILAILPFLLILLLHFFNLDLEKNNGRFKAIYIILVTISIVILIGLMTAPFLNILASSDYGDIKLYLLFQFSLLILLFIIKFRKQALLLFLIMVCLLRLAFDWFVLPIQLENYAEVNTELFENGRLTKSNGIRNHQNTSIFHMFNADITRDRD
jgi:hypothetical protein